MAQVADDVFGKDNYERMKALLKERVSSKRDRHSKSVAKTAKNLAKVYGYDPAQARMAGILHDWDKGLTADEVRQRALDLGMEVDPVIWNTMPWLLHGPTAAFALSQEYPEFGADVFQAIARHTTGAPDMTPLDSIIYIADIIEPHRSFVDMEGIDRLRTLVGTIPLGQLYFEAFKYTMQFLVENDRQLAPGTVATWNSLMPTYGFIRHFL